MAIHKKEEFGKKKQHLAMFGRAIAHPARISILKILAKEENCNCNELGRTTSTLTIYRIPAFKRIKKLRINKWNMLMAQAVFIH